VKGRSHGESIAGLLSLFAGALLNAVTFAAHAQTDARPAIAANRWSEDWSVLADPNVPREPFDALKYIPLLGDDPQTYLSLGANIRERFETNDDQFGTEGHRRYEDVLSRLEAHADLRVAGHVQMFLQLQSDAALGKAHPSPVDQDRLGLEQAFFAIAEPLAAGTFMLRVGRQEDGFDLQRFLSLRDGPNVRQAYDGATAAYTRGPWRLIVLYTDPVQNRDLRAFDDYSSPHLSFGLFRIERRIGSSSSLSAYVGRFRQDAAHFLSASGNERRDLLDVRFVGYRGGFDWDTEVMVQAGSIGAQSILAWATGAIVGRTFNLSSFRLRGSLQFDAASGDKNPRDNQLNTFNPLFPSGDYFTTAGYTTYANLIHGKAGLSVTVSENLLLSAGVGLEWRQTVSDAIYTIPDVPVPNTAGRGSSYAGAYCQFRADYRLTPQIALALELVHFSAGQTIRAAGGHSTDYLGAEIRYGW
jgi:hypothetical protein